MGALTRTCPQCSTDNEIDTQVVPVDVPAVSCWFCASDIPVTRQGMMEARARPSMLEVQAPRPPMAMGGVLDGRVRTYLVWGGGALAVLLVLSLGVCGIRRMGREETPPEGAQFRGSYHGGDKRPTGAAAWEQGTASAGGFAPARTGNTLFVAANEPRTPPADSYSPREVPESVLPRLRKIHHSLISQGYKAVYPPETTALQPAQRDRFRVEMNKNACYRILAFGDSPVRNLQLLLYEPDGLRLILADPRGGQDTNLEYCPSKLGNFEIELRMRRGHGRVTHVAYGETDEPYHDIGGLYALDQATGESRWQRDLAEEISTAPASDEQYVVVGTRTRARSPASRARVEGGNVQVFAAADGSPVCTFEAEGPVTSSPIISDGQAFFGCCVADETEEDGDVCGSPGTPSPVYAIDLASCAELWNYRTRGPVVLPPVLDHLRLYVAVGQRLAAVNRIDGTEVWTADGTAPFTAPVLGGDHVVVGVGTNVRTFDRSTGEPGWSAVSDMTVGGIPATGGDQVFVGLADGTLLALDADDGERQWDLPLGGRIESAITIAAGLAIVATADQLVAVDADEGTQVFALPQPQGFRPGTATILFDGMLFATNRGGRVFALR